MSLKKNVKPIISLLGKELNFPSLTDDATIKRQTELISMISAAQEAINREPNNPVHYGKAAIYTMFGLNDFHEAVDILERGDRACPDSHIIYWLLVQAKITTRDFEGAIAYGERAVALTYEVPDHGYDLRVILGFFGPTKYFPATSHYAAWYHLGLAYYLAGDLQNSKRAFSACKKFVYGNDSIVSSSTWLYLVLRELGEREQADNLLRNIEGDINVFANYAYRDFCLLFNGTLSLEQFEKLTQNPDFTDESMRRYYEITYEYTIALWHYFNGEVERARLLFEKISAGLTIDAFVHIAAEAKLKQMQSA